MSLCTCTAVLAALIAPLSLGGCRDPAPPSVAVSAPAFDSAEAVLARFNALNTASPVDHEAILDLTFVETERQSLLLDIRREIASVAQVRALRAAAHGETVDAEFLEIMAARILSPSGAA